MKIKRQCGRCDHFNSVLVEPGEAVPAFKCSACGYQTARPRCFDGRNVRFGSLLGRRRSRGYRHRFRRAAITFKGWSRYMACRNGCQTLRATVRSAMHTARMNAATYCVLICRRSS